LILIFGHDVLTQCDYFNAESLIIKGNHRLSQEQILQQAWIKSGMNILSVNLSVARKRLLADPYIAEAEVSRELPNGIHIRIREHKPLAVLDIGRKFLINEGGEIFKVWRATDPADLPIISGLEFSDINVPGRPRSAPLEAVLKVLHLGQKPGSIVPNRQIIKIRVDREIGLTLYAFDQIKAIKLGYNDYVRKYEKLKVVLLHLSAKDDYSGFDSIDLNNINRIVISPAKHKSPAKDHKEV
jgi:cell division protein FtsQ